MRSEPRRAGLAIARTLDKRRFTTALAKYGVNPLARLAVRLGLARSSTAILETTGRRSGEPRRNPITNGLDGDTFWIVAEHGRRANYVRNIEANPRVRVNVDGRWRAGTAGLAPDDDPGARLRVIGRTGIGPRINTATVRLMGTDLLSVRIDLDRPATPPSAASRQPTREALEDGLRAGLVAAAVSGLPSTLHAIAVGGRPLEPSLAAGSMVLPRERSIGRLLAAAVPVHLALSLGWASVLAVGLPRRHTTLAGAAAGLAIAALDLGLVGRRFPRIRALPRLPQVADHVAFGAVTAVVVERRRHGREP